MVTKSINYKNKYKKKKIIENQVFKTLLKDAVGLTLQNTWAGA